MKTLYKCQYTGKIFDSELDCIEHEYEHGNEKQQFVDLINSFTKELESKHNVNVGTLKVYDYKENYYGDRIIHRRSVSFTFTLDGEYKEYFKDSDPVGDGRWNWDVEDTVESLIADFEDQYIIPKLTVFEGIVEHEYDEAYYNTWLFNGRNSSELFKHLEGKKVRISVIE